MHTWVKKNSRHIFRERKASNDIIFMAKTSRTYTFSLFKLKLV